MNSRYVLKYFRQAYIFSNSNKLLQISSKNLCNEGSFIKTKRYCSTLKCYRDKDPGPLFFSEEVQSLLKKLTGYELDLIFKSKHLENPTLKDEPEFLAPENVEEKNKVAFEVAQTFLQMPPVIQERKPIKEVLSFDPAIQGAETSNLIFTDISFGVSDRNRLIVVREPNGVLRKASWEERERMNCIYNPRPGSFYQTPQIFEEKYLDDALHREEYLFILDFACAHFEPDDPKYHEVTGKTYEHIKRKKNFSILHSSRHFGPMSFYYAWNKNIDGLLEHFIENERLEESVDLIRLYFMINDNSKLTDIEKKEDKLKIVKNFIEEEAHLKSALQLVVQNYEEVKRAKEDYENKLKSSHGIL